MLAQVGTLEALAVNLAPWIVATGRSLSSGSEYAPGSNTSHDFLKMNTHSRLSPILHAIGAIIQNSRPRTIQFLSAPALTSAFHKLEADAGCVYERRPAWDTGISNPFNNRQAPPSVVESLIPPLPSSHFRSSLAPPSNFPPLGGIGTSARQSQASRSFSSAIEVIQSQGLDFVGEEESPLVTWLVHAFRISDEETGLMAAWVLAIFYRQGLTKRSKEAAIALLLVPSLVRMLDRDLDAFLEAPSPYDNSILISPEKAVREQAPAVLAMLTANSLETQKAAADAGAIKKLSQLLKQSYDPLPVNPLRSLWTAESSPPVDSEPQENACRLGMPGVSPLVYHILRLRETVLVALAAMASNKDEYRKAIIENGVIPFVIKTLKVDASESLKSLRQTNYDETTNDQNLVMGNCRDAVLAACGAARALSRSVATLRTSLMDAGLSGPLFVLLTSQDIEIKVAATAVVCNLVLDFSPMREVRPASYLSIMNRRLILWQAIIEGGILKILCEHAHSMNANLRLNSMWALKNLMSGASNLVKMRCLEELGPGWLKQIVNNDRDAANSTTTMRNGDREDGSATPVILSTPNAAGVQVDLLNAVEEDSRDSSQDREEDGEEDLKMSESIEGLSKAEPDRKRNTIPLPESNGRGPLLEIGEDLARVTDINSNRGVSDEIAIQKEGLEFIRNLLCGPQSSEMVDYLFRELGQDKVFDLLAAKLRPRVLNAFNRDRRSSENGVKCIQPVADLVISVCYILVHIAAGLPRHRQLLVSQTELLNLMVPLFVHPSREVRSSCAWFVINLTWVEDQSDNINCKARARELAKLGFFEKLEGMEKDESLDCRERCKTALNQMSGLLRMA